MINTNGSYYWVLGNSSWQCSAEKAAGFDYTLFSGDKTISTAKGAMFCIWCDVGNAASQESVVSATADVITAFGSALPGADSGNGTAEYPYDMTDAKNADVLVGLKLGESCYLTMGAEVVWKTSDPSVLQIEAYEVNTLTANYYAQPGEMDGDTEDDGVTATTVKVTATGIGEATLTAGTTNFDASVRAANQKTVTVAVGGTTTVTVKGFNYAGGTYTPDPAGFATVEVTGTNGTEDTTNYTKADVSCSTLLGSNSNSWTAASGYYYKADDGSYYPVYAKRSSSWGNYTYTWGYSKTDSSSDVTPIGKAQSTYFPSYTTPDITVYTASTEDGTPASTTITFTGVSVGTTYVTIGDTKYTIDVKAEDLSLVTPLTVEFWITNQRVTAKVDGSDVTSMTIAATEALNTESGLEFSTLVPATGTMGGHPMVFWKGTRLPYNNKQTTGGGVDKTKSGTDFAYIRYWNGSWAYSADRRTWTNVEDGDQIIAYYLQKTEVTDEITTLVSDYGNVPGYGSSLKPFVMVDYAVRYETGERTPSSFPTEKTIAFHCNYSSAVDLGNTVIQDGTTYYRKLGTIRAVETANYEVYMITLTPTSDTKTDTIATNAQYATSYTYEGTEKVVWVDDEANLGDFADPSLHYTSPSGSITYGVGGDPDIAGLEVYKNQGMLVTYYVRAKVTPDSLAVHYIDQTANQEFYSYNIAVKSGTFFHENIGLANPWKGNLATAP